MLIYGVPQAHLDHQGLQVSISGIIGRWGDCEEAEIRSLSSALPLACSLLQDLPFRVRQDPEAPQVKAELPGKRYESTGTQSLGLALGKSLPATSPQHRVLGP